MTTPRYSIVSLSPSSLILGEGQFVLGPVPGVSILGLTVTGGHVTGLLPPRVLEPATTCLTLFSGWCGRSQTELSPLPRFSPSTGASSPVSASTTVPIFFSFYVNKSDVKERSAPCEGLFYSWSDHFIFHFEINLLDMLFLTYQ